MGLDDRTHDRQTQTCSARCAVARGVGALEAIKRALALVGGNTRAVVLDEESYALVRGRLNAHAHQPPLHGGVLNRVSHQVAQRLSETVGGGLCLARPGMAIAR